MHTLAFELIIRVCMPSFYAYHCAPLITERADGSVNIPATSPHNHDRQQPSSNNPPWKRGSRGSSATRMNLAHLHQNPVQLRVHHPSQRRQQRYANNPPTDGANGHKHPFPSLRMTFLLARTYGFVHRNYVNNSMCCR